MSSSSSNQSQLSPITTRLAERKLSNSDPVWGFKTQEKFFRVMKGTAVPNSSIRAKILNSERLAKENIAKNKGSSSSTEDEAIAAVQKRGKSLEELKILNNLLKKTYKVEKRTPSVKKTRFEIIIEAIRDSKKKALETLREQEEQLLEEPEVDKFSSSSSTTTIEMSKLALDKAQQRRQQRKKLKKLEEKKTKKGKKAKNPKVKLVEKSKVVVSEKKEQEEEKTEENKTETNKTKPKKKVSISTKKTSKSGSSTSRANSANDTTKPSKGILPLRSRQDFTTAEVMSFLKNREIFVDHE